MLLLAPAWIERAHYDERGADDIHAQQLADATEGRDVDRLLAIAKSRGGGRVYAGLRGNWGQQYRVGQVPVHAWLADRDVDAIGFTFRTVASLSTDTEARFDETNPADYQMFGVRYLLLPSDRPPPVPARLVAQAGRHRLYEVPTSGYVQVVDRASPVAADRTNLADAVLPFMQSSLASRGVYPGVTFAGGKAPQPTFAGANPPPGPAGRVLSQRARLEDGVVDTRVRANRRAVVLLKASFDPRWTATVDGSPAKPSLLAPSLVGVTVPAGDHVVEFRYRPYAHYPLLLALGALTLLALALLPYRRPPPPRPPPPRPPPPRPPPPRPPPPRPPARRRRLCRAPRHVHPHGRGRGVGWCRIGRWRGVRRCRVRHVRRSRGRRAGACAGGARGRARAAGTGDPPGAAGHDARPARRAPRPIRTDRPLTAAEAEELLAATTTPLVLATDGERWRRLTDPDTAAVAPAAWRELPVALVDVLLVGKRAVVLRHSVAAAVDEARRSGGVALLVPATPTATVLDLAARGVLMPRKSTFFVPKPRTGLVLRCFADQR